MARRPSATVLVWALLSFMLLIHALPRNDALGLYYDEAFMAAQARDFVEPDRGGRHPASVRSVDLFGRPFPVRNAAYLGSLKSQLVIPAFSLFGASPFVLRATTWATALLALLFAMLYAERTLGSPVAWTTGLLVATDPSFYFLGQFEWGPFTTNLLCRCLGAYLLVAAWARGPGARGTGLAAAGGAVLGLGIFSRADFGLILASAGIALLAAHPDLILAAVRGRRAAVVSGSVTLLVCASPMLFSGLSLMTSSAAIADRGGVDVKAAVLGTVLDGSHFHRLMQVGGRFDEIFGITAPAGLFGWVLLLASAVLVALGLLARGGDARLAHARLIDSGAAFLLISSVLLVVGMLVMPGAVRAHHQLNAMPLLQLIVALAGISLWQAAQSVGVAAGRATAVGLALLLTLTCAANLRVIRETERLIDASGGRGRWSKALDDFALEIEGRGDQEVVSLDWGFHENLLFLTRRTRLAEPIWTIPHALRAGRPWLHRGDANTHYLIHDASYDLFGLGPRLLDALDELPEHQRSEVEITPHLTGEGQEAFYAVRILRPHELSYGGRFRIR